MLKKDIYCENYKNTGWIANASGTIPAKRKTAAGRKQKLRRKQIKRRIRRMIGLCIMLLAIAVLLWLGRRNLVLENWENDNNAVDSETVWTLKESGDYPDSLLQLLQDNPETRQFVLDYPGQKDVSKNRDVSGEIRKGQVPLFLQWDERWGYENYGGDFLAVTGCGPTCLSMVYCGLTGDGEWNPYRMAQFSEENGYYVTGSGTSWDLMTYGAQQLGLEASEVIFDEEHIRRELAEGHPIICSMRPGDFTTAGHFIVLKGEDQDGNIQVCDPNSRIRSEQSWKLEELMPQIKNLWSYWDS